MKFFISLFFSLISILSFSQTYDITVYVKCIDCKIEKIEYYSHGLYHISNNFSERKFNYKADKVEIEIFSKENTFEYYVIIDNYKVLDDKTFNYLWLEVLYNPVKNKE